MPWLAISVENMLSGVLTDHLTTAYVRSNRFGESIRPDDQGNRREQTFRAGTDAGSPQHPRLLPFIAAPRGRRDSVARRARRRGRLLVGLDRHSSFVGGCLLRSGRDLHGLGSVSSVL